MARALGVQLSLMLRTETLLKHSHNNHILWGEKGDVDLLCYSSGVRIQSIAGHGQREERHKGSLNGWDTHLGNVGNFYPVTA